MSDHENHHGTHETHPIHPDVKNIEVVVENKSENHDHHKTEADHHPAEKHDHDSQEITKVKEKIENQKTNPSLGDFVGEPLVDGKLILQKFHKQFLDKELLQLVEEVKNSPVAVDKGYKVAAEYDSQVQGWTTQSKIFTLPNGKKLFVLINFTASKWRRWSDRFMEAISGDEMRKPKNADWKKTVESRSNVPTVAGLPDNIVAMPYIESINAYDVFAHQKDIKNFGNFGWAKDLKVNDKIDLLAPITSELKKVHASGKTWGDSILPNFILTKNREPLLVDAETTYENIDVTRQCATDLRNLITSACGALRRGDGIDKFDAVVDKVLSSYNDSNMSTALKNLCQEGLSWRKELFFNLFGRFRVGSNNLDEFYEVSDVIVNKITALEKAELAAKKAAKEAQEHAKKHATLYKSLSSRIGHGGGHGH